MKPELIDALKTCGFEESKIKGFDVYKLENKLYTVLASYNHAADVTYFTVQNDEDGQQITVPTCKTLFDVYVLLTAFGFETPMTHNLTME